MTLEELSKETGYALSTLKNQFPKTKINLEKKGIIINRVSRGNYTIEYLENAKINAYNLTLYKFSKLQPLSKLKERRNGSVVWHCKCDCGKECDIRSDLLLNGQTKSCGCLLKEQLMKDIQNQKFGRLIALYPTDKRSGTSIVWHCLCECGNECDVSSNDLSNGNTKSCGCLCSERAKILSKNNIIDISNQRFGKLIALTPSEERSGSSVIWNCKCDCGNICKINSRSLISGVTQSCGCLKISHGELKITNLLNEANIEYISEYKAFQFKDSKYYARFDFFINNSYFIEFDGEQHFKYNNKGWNTEENFLKVQEHDKIKNVWCKDNNIPLIRIPYTHLKELCLEDLLLETTKWRVV